ncbi:hypothetical protein Xcel_0813 [Xylanimonas cellulosilytica DSM 15894]|uniref:Uncharacterized protein n=1 Tax=Xylanimonas cellulosilytica (strain DSM 15894 / JCM 12276 / CECT 5975 / KCTC 9989 / LMG 20990 / NBRC 107835 / XIL07) TaxID=446471 RepID=D1BY07_XYLCX|nr:hypothetical protein [Xylanimonas cellulosilytica]ACZ29850.1 hypothetical protein Xcel_0813 [Xylanimonas cellulosilytica DSM 15894]
MDPIADFPDAIAPIINAETGEVARGSFRFAPSFFDDNNLANVAEHAYVSCLRENGYENDQTRWRPADDVMKNDSLAGVWRVEDAERFAFVRAMSAADMVLNDVENAVLSDAERAEAQAQVDRMREVLEARNSARQTEAFKAADAVCDEDPEVVRWRGLQAGAGKANAGPWWEEFDQAMIRAFEGPRMTVIEDDFAACLEASGARGVDPQMRGYDKRFAVEGQDFRVDEQQITLALIAVQCKASINGVERMMNLVAEYEAPVYLKYRAELDERVAEVADERAAVAEYWARHAE